MADDIQSRADRVLAQHVELIEDSWLRSGREGMGRRFVEVVETFRPDGLLAFAMRPHPWTGSAGPIPWDESAVVVVIRPIEGTTRRTIPCPRQPSPRRRSRGWRC